ncbi:MAG: glutaredoxin family protein [bacterium]|nr:glutaredoxin family protein [bacterium]
MAKKIVLFVKENCRQCDMTKKYLTENGADFEIRSLEERGNIDEVKSLGYSAAPVTIFGDTVDIDGTEAILKEGLLHFAGFAPGKLAQVVADYKKSLQVS